MESLGVTKAAVKQFLLCSECGLTSGRKWNIQRHIAKRHKSVGKVMASTEYMLKSQQGLVPPPSYFRPPGYQGKTSMKDSPSNRLQKRAFARSLRLIPKAMTTTQTRGLHLLKLSICERCLTYIENWEFLRSDNAQLGPRFAHECDFAGLLDDPSLMANREAAIELLKQKAPEHLASMVHLLAGEKVSLLAVHRGSSMSRDDKVDAAIVERLFRDIPKDRVKITKAIMEYLTQAPSTGGTEKPHNLSIVDNNWLIQVLKSKDTLTIVQIGEADLVQFLSRELSTSIRAVVDGEDYLFQLNI